jgi:hypothetical protein
MKVFLNYEDNKSKLLHKKVKITLPKKWKTGPTSTLMLFGVESYNASDLGKSNPLDASQMHLAVKVAPKDSTSDEPEGILTPLASDAVILEVIDDRDATYICHGASKTLQEIEQEKQAEIDRKKLNWQVQLLAYILDARIVGSRERLRLIVPTMLRRQCFTKLQNSGRAVLRRKPTIGKTFKLSLVASLEHARIPRRKMLGNCSLVDVI